MREVLIHNKTRNLNQPIVARYCDTYFSRLRGLMFYRKIEPYQGALLVDRRESRVDAAIHMFFMNFDIAVFWLDAQKRVIDRKIARRWRSVLKPSAPAQYVLETLPQHYDEILDGDLLEFEFES